MFNTNNLKVSHHIQCTFINQVASTENEENNDEKASEQSKAKNSDAASLQK